MKTSGGGRKKAGVARSKRPRQQVLSVAEAKATLSDVVARAAAGETICITRRGRPVAQVAPVARPRLPLDVSALRRLTGGMPLQTTDAADFVRQMRDEDRY